MAAVDGTKLIAGLAGGIAAPGLPATMLVSAHPDDEAIGAGSRLARLRDAWFVHVTDGAPRDGMDAARHGLAPHEYGRMRSRELRAALALCGVPAGRALALGCPDQQAALHLAPLALRLARLFLERGVRAVLTHPYEGGHPDHDATAFAVHAAAALLQQAGAAPPALVEMACYHLGPQGIRPGAFLPDAWADGGKATVPLALAEQRHKRELFACFASQRDTLAWFPLDVERFRPAPHYDFLRPPHAGPLFYELHAWGMTGERFRALAAAAMARLGLEGRL